MSAKKKKSKPKVKRIERLGEKVNEWLFISEYSKKSRIVHLSIIAALFAIGIFAYYVDQTSLVNHAPFDNSFFTSVHDIHRTLFLIPIVYSAVVFRVNGGIISSVVFLCIILPRAVHFSPYPDPMLRSLIFVVVGMLLSMLVATQLNFIERERLSRKRLATTYKKLSEYHNKLKDSQEQLIQAEKLTSLGQLAAQITHEINNPMASILAYTQLLSRQLKEGEISKETALNYLGKIEAETSHSSKLVNSLLDFARRSPPKRTEADLNELLEKALELIKYSTGFTNIEVDTKLAKDLPKVTVDADQMRQVFVNLILNATQVMPKGGTLTLKTKKEGEEAVISIKDTGFGISKQNMRKLFEPFFTTKDDVQGVGLGLSVSYGIVKRHHGRIEVQSKEGKGTTFTIYLPLTHEDY